MSHRLAERGYYDPLLGYDVSHMLPRHVGSRVIELDDATECWRPAADVFETDEAMVVHCDLPGVPKEEIALDIRGNSLYIHGQHHGPQGFEAAASRVRERQIGKFRKIVRLPDEVVHDVDRIKATYRDGLLSVEIPKIPEQTGTKIAIA